MVSNYSVDVVYINCHAHEQNTRNNFWAYPNIILRADVKVVWTPGAEMLESVPK